MINDNFCSIIQRITTDPYKLHCGHLFDRLELYKWICRSPTCPSCRTEVSSELKFKARVITFLHTDLTQGVLPVALFVAGVTYFSFQQSYYYTAASLILFTKSFPGIYGSLLARFTVDDESLLDYGHLALSFGIASMIVGTAIQSNTLIYAAVNLCDLGTILLGLRLFLEYAELSILSAVYGIYLAACLSPLFILGRI